MNNQFLQHLKSITPQGRAENTNMFIPADKLQEGSRGIVRHERIMRSKNVKNTQEKDRQQISRERRRAGLSPQIPSSSINKVITSDEGREGRGSIYRTKSIDKPIVGKNPKDVAAGARVPKAVKKYRDASSAKGRLGKNIASLWRAVREETSKTPKFYKKLKKVKKAFRRTVRGMANILQKPSDASDVMITGRTF